MKPFLAIAPAAFCVLLAANPGCAHAESTTTLSPPNTPQVQPAEAAPATTPEVEALLDKIEAAAAEVQTLKANLRYDRFQDLLGDEQRRFGTFQYAAGSPAKFDAHFDRLLVDGKARRIDLRYTFDGVWLAERDEQDKAFTRRQLVAEGEAGQPMQLGKSPFVLPLDAKKEDILARFAVRLAEPDKADPKGTIHLVLTPLPNQRMDQTRVDLWYDEKSMLPVRVQTLDESENRSVIDLMKVEVNRKLDARTFDTSPPTGGGWSIHIEPLPEDAADTAPPSP